MSNLRHFTPANGWTSNDLYPRQLADVNGDGMADIVGFGSGGVSVVARDRRRPLRLAVLGLAASIRPTAGPATTSIRANWRT